MGIATLNWYIANSIGILHLNFQKFKTIKKLAFMIKASHI